MCPKNAIIERRSDATTHAHELTGHAAFEQRKRSSAAATAPKTQHAFFFLFCKTQVVTNNSWRQNAHIFAPRFFTTRNF